MQCMIHQHCAIGLQTGCMVIVVAPVVRLPDPHVYALWPQATGCQPCNSNARHIKRLYHTDLHGVQAAILGKM